MEDRPILNQGNYSVKEIYQDFYKLLAERVADRGYKYRKFKHDLRKSINNYTIFFDYQTFSYNCLGEGIDIYIHKRIDYQGKDGKTVYRRVYDMDGRKNAVTDIFNIQHINDDELETLLGDCEAYLKYMEELVSKLITQ